MRQAEATAAPGPGRPCLVVCDRVPEFHRDSIRRRSPSRDGNGKARITTIGGNPVLVSSDGTARPRGSSGPGWRGRP